VCNACVHGSEYRPGDVGLVPHHQHCRSASSVTSQHVTTDRRPAATRRLPSRSVSTQTVSAVKVWPTMTVVHTCRNSWLRKYHQLRNVKKYRNPNNTIWVRCKGLVRLNWIKLVVGNRRHGKSSTEKYIAMVWTCFKNDFHDLMKMCYFEGWGSSTKR